MSISSYSSKLHFIFWMYVPRSPGCPHLPDLKTVVGKSLAENSDGDCSKLHFIFWMYVPRSPGCPHLPDLKTVLGKSLAENSDGDCSKLHFIFWMYVPNPDEKRPPEQVSPHLCPVLCPL